MYSRRDIFPDKSFAHVFFRCHNKSMLLRPNEIKDKLLELIAKYKSKYHIKIFDFCIMDNHVHLYLWAPNAHALGGFMRTVESLLARKINQFFKRDSQAIRGRYKSKVICNSRASYNLVKYIYRNRYEVDKTLPNEDFYNSAYWRVHKPFKWIENPKDEVEKINNLYTKLLDDYEDSFLMYHISTPAGVLKLVSKAMKDADDKVDYGFSKSSHTIGTDEEISYRDQIIRSGKRDTGPPIHEVGSSSLYN